MTATPARRRAAALVAAGAAALLGLAVWTARDRLSVSRRAGVEWVRVPGGELETGGPDAPGGAPARRVRVAPFELGRTEVTVSRFSRFVEATGHRTDAERAGGCLAPDDAGDWARRPERSWRDPGFPQGPDHPVVCVSWEDAAAFARWAGARLPTEEEWEYAAGNGARRSAFAWGDGMPSGRRGGNVADERAVRRFRGWQGFEGYDDGHLYTAPAGSYEPNALGLDDMTGNAREWCADAAAPAAGAPGAAAVSRANRGGSWADPPFLALVSRRTYVAPFFRSAATGFRLAR